MSPNLDVGSGVPTRREEVVDITLAWEAAHLQVGGFICVIVPNLVQNFNETGGPFVPERISDDHQLRQLSSRPAT